MDNRQKIESRFTELTRNPEMELQIIRTSIEEFLEIDDLSDAEGELDEFAVEDLEGLIGQYVIDSDQPDGVGSTPLDCPLLLDYLFELSEVHEQLSDLAVLIANSPYCSKDLLTKLAQVDNTWDTGISVRMNVACNGATAADTLQYIWDSVEDFEGESFEDLVWCLARNPLTPIEILERIAMENLNDTSRLVGNLQPGKAPLSYALAANPSTPIEILNAMLERGEAFSPESWTRESLSAANQNMQAQKEARAFIATDSVQLASRANFLRRFQWE